jgi:hypothetical protein
MRTAWLVSTVCPCAVHGGGVAELDMFGDVVGRQRDPTLRAGMPYIQSTDPDRGDGPAVAVSDEVGARQRKATVIRRFKIDFHDHGK